MDVWIEWIARIVVVRCQDAQQLFVVEHQNINLHVCPLWDFLLLLRTITDRQEKSSLPIHNLLHGDAASNLGVDSKAGDGDGSWDLVGRGEGGRHDHAADLDLRVDASFPIARRATAAQGQAWCTGPDHKEIKEAMERVCVWGNVASTGTYMSCKNYENP